jgi:hypothetical protein
VKKRKLLKSFRNSIVDFYEDEYKTISEKTVGFGVSTFRKHSRPDGNHCYVVRNPVGLVVGYSWTFNIGEAIWKAYIKDWKRAHKILGKNYKR